MARELKYSTRHTDFDALQREMRELSGKPSEDGREEQHDDDEDDYDVYRR